MSDIGWPTPSGDTLHLTHGYDFTYSFQLRDPSGNATNFPAGQVQLQFPTVDGASFGITGPSSGSVWDWTVYGSVATITVPSSVVDLIPDGSPWYLVWNPALQPRFDAVGSGSGSSTTVSWSHTIGGNAIVVFANVLATGTTTPGTVTMTCGGQSMTQLASVANYYSAGSGGNNVSLYAFGLLNPPTGVKTVTMNLSAVRQVGACSMSYSNVGSFSNAVTAGPSLPTTMSVSSVGSALVAQAFSGYTAGFSNYSQTLRSYLPFVNAVHVDLIVGDAPIQDVTTQPALSFSVVNTSTPWAGIAVPLVPSTLPSTAGYALGSGLVSAT